MRTAARKPPCQTVLPWLKSNLGKSCLAPLTGTDSRALAAAVQTIELYSEARNPHVLLAFSCIVRQMQDSTQELAYHAIAHVLNWEDRARLWMMADLQLPKRIRVCAFEPGGTMVSLYR